MTGTAGGRDRRRWEAEQALTALYDRHYRALTQLAVLLVDDIAVAEEVAQAAFAALHGVGVGRQPLDGDKALSSLRRAVIGRARSHRAAQPRQPQAAHGPRQAGTLSCWLFARFRTCSARPWSCAITRTWPMTRSPRP